MRTTYLAGASMWCESPVPEAPDVRVGYLSASPAVLNLFTGDRDTEVAIFRLQRALGPLSEHPWRCSSAPTFSPARDA